MATVLRIGSRPSQLAMVQAGIVRERITALAPELECEIIAIRTSGDANTAGSLAQIGGKGLFIKELEEALAARRVDIAVHSMKDLPALLPPAYRIAAVPERANPRDALVTRTGAGLAALPAGARLGTSSSRRRLQALRIRPDLEIVALRGNVDTRLRRLAGGEMDAVILAMAGLERLGRAAALSLSELEEDDFVPAGGQGALAIEALAGGAIADSAELDSLIGQLTYADALTEVTAERAFLARLGASCVTPVGVKATTRPASLSLRALLFSLDGRRDLFESASSTLGASPNETARALGEQLADAMISRGASELLGRA